MIPQPPLTAGAERTKAFTVGVRAFPYLADHGFQDMVVLPGAFYIEMALVTARELFGRVPRRLRNVKFQHPIILSDQDTIVRADVTDGTDAVVTLAFYEAHAGDSSPGPGARQYAATLEVDMTAPAGQEEPGDLQSIERFQEQATALIDADEFYKALRRNGNQYGPGFQHVSSIWRASDRSLGRISVPHRDADRELHCLHPSLLDSMTQLMAPFVMDKGQTFILRSIDTIELPDLVFPATLWGQATLLGDGDASSYVGNVRVFDESGRTHVTLSGVALTTLDDVAAPGGNPAMNLVVASNFTADPLEDPLKFWGDYFGMATRTEFAPYNQVFQQLLDSGSAFRRNHDGINVILLGLEEWAGHRRAALTLDADRAARCFGNRTRYVLPNGLEIVHLNRYETDYVYKEIFEDHCYLKHGIRIHDGDVVVDIGANIGLFSLFVLSRCPNAQIYAFEPAPAVYELLKANCEAYGGAVRALNLGVSDAPKTALFTFYERSSVFSGFHPDEADDRADIETIVRNTLTSHASIEPESLHDLVTELTADRMRQSVHECRMTSVSDIIRQHHLDRITLLKIDAEKSELDIISGIEDGDWPKIAQLVVEIHDRTGQVARRIEELLRKKGYRCAVDQETLLEDSGLFNLYAARDDEAGSRPASNTGQLQAHLRDFGGALRSFMDHSAVPLVLGICPRSPAAEADGELKAALDDAEQALLSEVRALPNVHTMDSASVLLPYRVTDYYDPHGHQLGHVPYTSECFAAIATSLVRTTFALNSRPFKVIVLDCDNTLWKGVCGEDGPLAVEVTPHHRALQDFMLRQMDGGMLLCVCSKNNEKDVLDVFDMRPDMVLRREHIVSWRVNWHSKAASIRSLADELDLGLDSFIFVDDNPVDIADVRIGCPGVVALQLPPDAGSFSSFLNHVWAFDRRTTTDEDRNRTRSYRENTERQRLREHSLSLKDFITGLDLRVEMSEATEEDIPRISQLTFRTNQFNLTTIRRTEDEVRRFLKRQDATCLVVRVLDRFGDYGLVGVLMYETAGDCCRVDTFLLSCRVLGRGVEHSALSQLARRAGQEGTQWVELACLPTGRNVPAREFLAHIGREHCRAPGTWLFRVEDLAHLRYDPDAEVQAARAVTPAADTAERRPRAPFSVAALGDRADRLQRIGEHLSDISRLSGAIEAHRCRQQPVTAVADVTAGATLEATLAAIWSKVLGRPQIGLHDNFFDVGGTSLRAVQVIASIRRELNQALSIVGLFECPTVALLAARLRSISQGAQAGATSASAALRGQQRRYTTTGRRAS